MPSPYDHVKPLLGNVSVFFGSDFACHIFPLIISCHLKSVKFSARRSQFRPNTPRPAEWSLPLGTLTSKPNFAFISTCFQKNIHDSPRQAAFCMDHLLVFFPFLRKPTFKMAVLHTIHVSTLGFSGASALPRRHPLFICGQLVCQYLIKLLILPW